MFYWSYENFQMVEEAFETRIKECISFTPLPKLKLSHGVFLLENGNPYYVLRGMLGFHIFKTDRLIDDDSFLFIEKDNGTVAIINKETAEPVKMERIMGLPLQEYYDVIPTLIHKSEEKPGSNHIIIIGHEPEDTDDMICVQKYHDGFRTVWMSTETFSTPIIIDDGRYSLSDMEIINDNLDTLESYAEAIKQKIKRSKEPIPHIKNINVQFTYNGKFYQLESSALEPNSKYFFYFSLDLIYEMLIETGAEFVMTNIDF